MRKFRKSVEKDGFKLIDPKEELKRITFSIILQTQSEINKEISQLVSSKAPKSIQRKLFFQPSDGYHMTLQWTNIPPENIRDKLTSDISIYIKEIEPPTVKFVGPYASFKNIFFIATTENSIVSIREGLDKILKNYDLETKLPLELDLLWISVCRFVEQPTNEEKEYLFNNLEQEVIENAKFPFVIVTENDPFFTKSSLILKEINL